MYHNSQHLVAADNGLILMPAPDQRWGRRQTVLKNHLYNCQECSVS